MESKATNENKSPRHFHILAPEVVDPISGRVMLSSHDWNIHSKISRVLEVPWGHSIVAAPRMSSIVSALEREGDYTTAAALRGVVPPDHPASFDEADHQRCKRNGVDLPRVREMVAQALASATSRVDFDTRLASIGLRIRVGDEKDIPISSLIMCVQIDRGAASQTSRTDFGSMPSFSLWFRHLTASCCVTRARSR
ncbi:hypothetical protein [Bradyrhizobium genosp. P]|uniref:hypothetical protein n=1 Tax=Bradyrhizobium genosp. P TaxID=83641 RepID=UPI003CEA87CC